MQMTDPDGSVLTVTLNPAIDVTYAVERMAVGAVHRVRTVRRRAGGKGVNVALVLHQLGVPVTATGMLAGTVGAQIRRELDHMGLAHAFGELPHGESRHTVTVVDDAGTSTLFNEPGPHIDQRALYALAEELKRRARHHEIVVLSGSLPAGAPDSTYATLVAIAKASGARTVLDTSGVWLTEGIKAGPDLVKPNREELLEASGLNDVASAAMSLRAAGAVAVAVSLGAEGLMLETSAGRWHRSAPEAVSGNATGAGDAAVAGLAMGLLQSVEAPELAALAVAAGTAAMYRPTAGEIDLEVFSSLTTSARDATVELNGRRHL